jgi:hypothetical protein
MYVFVSKHVCMCPNMYVCSYKTSRCPQRERLYTRFTYQTLTYACLTIRVDALTPAKSSFATKFPANLYNFAPLLPQRRLTPNTCVCRVQAVTRQHVQHSKQAVSSPAIHIYAFTPNMGADCGNQQMDVLWSIPHSYLFLLPRIDTPTFLFFFSFMLFARAPNGE